MPHEHVNSSFVPRDDEGRATQRVIVQWERAVETDDGGFEPGTIQICSEWLTSTARFPSPEVIEIDPAAPHAFAAVATADVDPDQDVCRWCHRTYRDGPHEIIDPNKPHLFRAKPNRTSLFHAKSADMTHRYPGCVHCGRMRDSLFHVSDTAVRDVELAALAREKSADQRDIKSDVLAAAYGATPEQRDALQVANAARTRVGHHQDDPSWTSAIDAPPDAEPAKIRTEGENTWSEPCTGFFVSMSRNDANHLVRKLRRAIRDAFGGDA